MLNNRRFVNDFLIYWFVVIVGSKRFRNNSLLIIWVEQTVPIALLQLLNWRICLFPQNIWVNRLKIDLVVAVQRRILWLVDIKVKPTNRLAKNNAFIHLASILIQKTALLLLQLQWTTLLKLFQPLSLRRLIQYFCIAAATELKQRFTRILFFCFACTQSKINWIIQTVFNTLTDCFLQLTLTTTFNKTRWSLQRISIETALHSPTTVFHRVLSSPAC